MPNVCIWSPAFGNHPDYPPQGTLRGSDTERALSARHQTSLIWGKRANGEPWMMAKEILDKVKDYRRQAAAARIVARGQVPPPRTSAAGERSVGIDHHSPKHCDVCLKLQETLHDTTFCARANMFVFPSKGAAKAHAPSIGVSPIAETTGAGVAAEASKGAAAKEEASVGEEREVSVLLDTGASGRNFISSNIASWLIERGSPTFFEDGEVGLAQRGQAIQFHQYLSFELRFVNSKARWNF